MGLCPLDSKIKIKWLNRTPEGEGAARAGDTSLPMMALERLRPYWSLLRLDKPIGTWLLFWPCAWSIGMAGYAAAAPHLDWKQLALFATGAVIMRGAGCTLNDLCDRDIDAQVERTRNRPMACGLVTPRQALVALSMQLTAGLAVLLQLNRTSIALGAVSLLPAAVYPLMKRITHWPQLVLGLAFNWGALLGWTAVTGTVGWGVVVPLYAAGVCWTLVYDTIYALQDIRDDCAANVKSTALLFGGAWRRWLSVFAASSIGALCVAGYANGHGVPYYVGVGAAALHYTWQISVLRPESMHDCLAKFKSNRTLGALVFAGICADVVYRGLAVELASVLAGRHAFL